jgi:hypothetical protein
LARCATEEPAAFVKVASSLMPRDINLNVGLDATDFASKFRTAVELLGDEPASPPRRPLKANGKVRGVSRDAYDADGAGSG